MLPFDPGYYIEKRYRDEQRRYYEQARRQYEKQLRQSTGNSDKQDRKWYKSPAVLTLLVLSSLVSIRLSWTGISEYLGRKQAQILLEAGSRKLYQLNNLCLAQTENFKDIIQCVKNEATAESELVDILRCSSNTDAYFSSIAGTSFKYCKEKAMSLEGKEACGIARDKAYLFPLRSTENQSKRGYLRKLSKEDLVAKVKAAFGE